MHQPPDMSSASEANEILRWVTISFVALSMTLYLPFSLTTQ